MGNLTSLHMLWIDLILLGAKTFAQVPRQLKEGVALYLCTNGFCDLVTDEKYHQKHDEIHGVVPPVEPTPEI